MALSHYSIVQFVPSPERDERVNIGLLLVSPELRYAAAYFDDPQRRGHRLAPSADLAFLEDVRREFAPLMYSRPQLALDHVEAQWTRGRLQQLHEDAGNVVQFTLPRAAITEDPAALLNELRAKFLGDIVVRPRARSVRAIQGTIRRAFDAVGRGDDLKPDFPVRGRHDSYVMPFALQNGRTQQLIDTLSLRRADAKQIHVDIQAAGYRFHDLREAHYASGLALVVAAPSPTHELVRLTADVLEEFRAQVVLEDHVDPWVRELAH